jgi:hypothetical protein
MFSFIPHLLPQHLTLFPAFSYSAQFHCTTSSNALNFYSGFSPRAPNLRWCCRTKFSAWFYITQFHHGPSIRLIFSAPSPTTFTFILRLLLRRLLSFCAFSYDIYFHSALSPTTFPFILRLLLWRLLSFWAFSSDVYSHFALPPMTFTFILSLFLRLLLSFLAFSYDFCFHSVPSPMTITFIMCLLQQRLLSFCAFSYELYFSYDFHLQPLKK